jgi:hypothetical protein
MTSKNSTPKTTESVEGVEAEASVPQQSTSTTDKVTVLKGRSEDGKDAIVIGEVDNSMKGKFNRLIRNKKVLAGVGAVAGLVVIAIIKSAVGANNTEFEYTVAEQVEPEGDDEADTETTD